MSNITILDTGYLNITNTGTAETAATGRANSGNAIELKAVEMSLSRGAGIDDTPILSDYFDTSSPQTGPILNFASVEAMNITITGILDRRTSTDMDLIPHLDRLITTKGIKLLYYNSTTDGYRDITDSLGINDTQHLSNTTPHLHVRFKSFTIRHTSDKSFLRFTLTCLRTT